MFCEQIPSLETLAAQGYVCGLLHDIGRFVQFEGARADMCKVDDRHWAAPHEVVEMEREALGYDHVLLGWGACKKWCLPAAIGEVVRRHHDCLPACPSDRPGLLQVIQWADVLSVALFMKPDLPFAPPEELTRRLAAESPGIVLGMPPVSETSWHHRVAGVHVQSMQLAHELICFPDSQIDPPLSTLTLATTFVV
jgi:hypothetical protein